MRSRGRMGASALAIIATFAGAAPHARAESAPLAVREVSIREDGVFFTIEGEGASGLAPGAVGVFAEEVRFGERAYRRTLARFEIVEVGPSGARARVTARVEGWLPLPGALPGVGGVQSGPVEPKGPDGVENAEEATLALAPFEIVLAESAEEGAPERLVVEFELAVPSAAKDRMAAEVDRSMLREIRSEILAVLLSLGREDLARTTIQEETARIVTERLNRLFLADPESPEGPRVNRAIVRQWTLR